eukprot:XP_017944950.1 PREDICTED: histidine N-acetyltransferase-like [Xenopus tropicalis]
MEAEAPRKKVEMEAEAPRKKVEMEAEAPIKKVEMEAEAPRKKVEMEAEAPRKKVEMEVEAPIKKIEMEVEAPRKKVEMEAEAICKKAEMESLEKQYFSLRDVQILPATASNYSEVMAISNGINDGLDYLPYKYHEWLADPNRSMFIAKFKGKVVAFLSTLLLDGGITALLQSLRVAPIMRGHGIAGVIRRYALDNLRSKNPEVTKIRGAQRENPPAALLKKYDVVHSKAVVSVLLPNNQMEDSIKALRLRVKRDYVGAPPVVLSPLEVLDLFENPCILEHLFPKGLLIGGSLPLAAHKCNLKLMLGSGLLWIYSKSTNSYTPSSSVTQCSHPAPTHINPPPQHPPLPHVSPELLSLSSAPIPVPLAKGTHCLNIDHFGTNPRSCLKEIMLSLHHHLRKERNVGMYHPCKPDQIRVVFDSSSRYEGVSLNDFLFTGPSLSNNPLYLFVGFGQSFSSTSSSQTALLHP